MQIKVGILKEMHLNFGQWSVVAEWLGRRTLNQRVVGSNPGEGNQVALKTQNVNFGA
jgi:hypothetical protein